MKKLFYTFIFIATALLASCGHEWDGLEKPEEPYRYDDYVFTPNITIQELKALYKDGKPVHIEKDLIIGGQVTTSDQAGNVYRSFYIQDNTGGIEIKVGRTGLYNDYKLGQWVYIKLSGLTLGAYESMLQIGLEDPTGEYETTYMDIPVIINQHIFKGKIGTPVFPKEIEESEVLLPENMGRYVTLKGLKYGNEIFSLLYVDQNGDKKSSSNRVFLSDKTWGVNTWAMSQNKMQEYLDSGVWDTATTADGSYTVAELRRLKMIDVTANYVSQYFKMGSTEIQIRTSGYSKFADYELDPEVLAGNRTINITGILTNYRGAAQFTLIDHSGVIVK